MGAVLSQRTTNTMAAHGKTGLLVIDLQNDYYPGGKFELHNVEQASSNAARLLQAFRAKDLPCFHVRHEAADPALGFFLPGTPGADFHEQVKPQEGEAVVTKTEINSFKGTDLEAKIKAAGVDNLVVCGAMTHMCIDSGVRAASDLGFKCVVPGDACATRDAQFQDTTVKASDVHTAYLAALNFAFAKVVSTDDILKTVST